MPNDVHMMVLTILATQAGIAVLLIVTAMLEPGRRAQDTSARASRPAPVPRGASRGGVRIARTASHRR